MRKLFGTDGIRGVAGTGPLSQETVYSIGIALARFLGAHTKSPRILLGADTRESSPWIAAVLAQGLDAGGAQVANAGVITTPGVAYLTRKHGFAAGVVISASHNPWQDNGIKIFAADGYKLPDEVELEIEAEIFRQTESHAAPGNSLKSPSFHMLPVDPTHVADYKAYLLQLVAPLSLAGLKIVLDCANGASSAIAPGIFQELGAELHLTHADPDGRNINAACGALHPEIVASATKAEGADLGITFDGDADRALFADHEGNVVNGDGILLLAARDLKEKRQLNENLVVATTMSNMGLEAALRADGIRMMRAPVGDKYVLEWMRQHHASLGGEQSGHILFPALSTTGDGLLTALVVLAILRRQGKSLHELVAGLKVYPQVIINIKVREKLPFHQLPSVSAAIRKAEEDLNENGRVVVRYSGTETLARVMIEAESTAAMEHHSHRIAEAIRQELGV